MFSIGEFSRITGLSVKTLRFYHEKGILVPCRVEAGSGYRFYDGRNAETARTIVALRDYGFPLTTIATILADHSDEEDLVEFLQQRKQELHQEIAKHREVVSSLDQIIQRESEAREMKQTNFEIEEKELAPQLVAGVRMKGSYDEMGKGFAKIGRAAGRHIAGKYLCLYYDGEYREGDADFEPCMPIRKRVEADGLSVQELPGGKCVSLIHRGPYGEIGRTYERLLQYMKDSGYEMQLPTREVYLKGPGMIFKGNPKKYLTEIQILVEDASNGTA